MKPKTCILTIEFQTLNWFAILIFSLTLVKAEGNGTEVKGGLPPLSGNLVPSESCPNIMCTVPPTGIPCNKTPVVNPNIIARLGSLKNCCAAHKCLEKDGSVSTYFGITGDENYDIVGNLSSAAPKDKCALITCPKPVESDAKCAISNASDVNDYKPRGDLQNCCPLYNCTVPADDTYHTRYVLQAGKIPTDPAVIAKEKGSTSPTDPAVNDKEKGKTTSTDPAAIDKEKGNNTKIALTEGPASTKCPAVRCTPKPTTSSCVSTSEKFSSTLETLGAFKECCPMWKCSFGDGAYFTHFEITTKSFWLAETSYFSPPPKIEPAPGLKPAQGRSAAAITPAPAPTKPPSPPAGNNQQQQQQMVVTLPKIVTSPKKKKDDEDDDEEEEDEDDKKEKDNVSKLVNPLTATAGQQQQSGNGNQQQQQMVFVQPVIINNFKERKAAKTTTTTTTTTETPKPKGLLSLDLANLKI